MCSHTTHLFSAKERNIKFLRDTFLLFKVKFISLIVRPLWSESFSSTLLPRNGISSKPYITLVSTLLSTTFRGKVNKEEIVLKSVLYVTLLQYYKFVLHKKTSLCSSAINWRRAETVRYIRGKSLPSNFNVEKMKCFHKQTQIIVMKSK
jgi:hypothetical protein